MACFPIGDPYIHLSARYMYEDQAQRQKLWEKLTSDPDVAAKCQILDGKSDEEKLHSMLNEEFWGVDVD